MDMLFYRPTDVKRSEALTSSDAGERRACHDHRYYGQYWPKLSGKRRVESGRNSVHHRTNS